VKEKRVRQEEEEEGSKKPSRESKKSLFLS
jgi:hypothetical protein